MYELSCTFFISGFNFLVAYSMFVFLEDPREMFLHNLFYNGVHVFMDCVFQSMDYNVVENTRFLQDQEKVKPQVRKEIWL